MYYATHRNPPTYRSTSNFASSVLRILEERAFAVGNYQSIIAITKIITVIVVIVIMLNDIPTSWELLAICLAFFPPSDTFFPYLLSFIQKVSENTLLVMLREIRQKNFSKNISFGGTPTQVFI